MIRSIGRTLSSGISTILIILVYYLMIKDMVKMVPTNLPWGICLIIVCISALVYAFWPRPKEVAAWHEVNSRYLGYFSEMIFWCGPGALRKILISMIVGIYILPAALAFLGIL